MLQLVCMCGTHGCVPFCMYFHLLQRQKSCTNKKATLNVHNATFSKFHALSNGALGFPVSSVQYAENVGCMQVQFRRMALYSFLYRISGFYNKKKGTVGKIIRNNILHLSLVFICIRLDFEENGNKSKPVCMPRIQTNRR
jgi:hypothetical protein